MFVWLLIAAYMSVAKPSSSFQSEAIPLSNMRTRFKGIMKTSVYTLSLHLCQPQVTTGCE